jgi:LCP family protein required for cell wall assembly
MLEDRNADGKVTNTKRSKTKTWKKLMLALVIVFCIIAGTLAVGGYYLLNLIQHVPLTEAPEPGPGLNPEQEMAESEGAPAPSGHDDSGSSTPDESNNTVEPLPAIDPSHSPVILDREDLMIPDHAPSPEETGIVNILLLGLDRRSDNEGARSDAIMIASIDKRMNRVKLTSLMRDMYVPIPGRQDNRINTGYIFGGPALAIKTVNKNFHMNIEHYVAVDFKGFTKIIDLLGGVEITLTQGEADIIGLESAGTYVLNGKEALAYSRIRKIGADYERTDRQRLVLSTLLKKAKSVSIWKIPELLVGILPNIETNLTKGEILALGINILDSSATPLEEYRLPAKGTYQSKTIRKMAVLVPDLEKNKQALHKFIYGDRFVNDD